MELFKKMVYTLAKCLLQSKNFLWCWRLTHFCGRVCVNDRVIGATIVCRITFYYILYNADSLLAALLTGRLMIKVITTSVFSCLTRCEVNGDGWRRNSPLRGSQSFFFKCFICFFPFFISFSVLFILFFILLISFTYLSFHLLCVCLVHCFHYLFRYLFIFFFKLNICFLETIKIVTEIFCLINSSCNF